MSAFFKFDSDFDWCLKNEFVTLVPLQKQHFDRLFAVASDPLIWEQHPNPNRFRLNDFTNFFKGAIDSDHAFLIIENASNEIMGCTRFYDFDATNKLVFIGYTFIGRNFWGKGFNQQIKKVMIEYAFEKADRILFHIGVLNIRSQTSILRIGANKIGEEVVEYFGEQAKLNYVYEILK